MTFEDCKQGNHSLVPVLSNGSEMEEHVCRWCRVCGAVVVDIDSDGRTMRPGGVVVMMFPEITRP